MSNEIESVLVENRVFPPFQNLVQGAAISGMDGYKALCAEAEKSPDAFWARMARENLKWDKPFTKVLDVSEAPFYRWRSEEHTSELQSLMRSSYAVFCLKKKKKENYINNTR